MVSTLRPGDLVQVGTCGGSRESWVERVECFRGQEAVELGYSNLQVKPIKTRGAASKPWSLSTGDGHSHQISSLLFSKTASLSSLRKLHQWRCIPACGRPLISSAFARMEVEGFRAVAASNLNQCCLPFRTRGTLRGEEKGCRRGAHQKQAAGQWPEVWVCKQAEVEDSGCKESGSLFVLEGTKQMVVCPFSFPVATAKMGYPGARVERRDRTLEAIRIAKAASVAATISCNNKSIHSRERRRA